MLSSLCAACFQIAAGSTSKEGSGTQTSNHQNHHQTSCCHIAARSTSKEGWGTQTSNHQNHHQTSCCHIAARSTSKEGWGTQTSNHQNSSKSSPQVLLSHCSRVNIKRRIRNTDIKSPKFIKIITKGLVVTLQPGQHQKKDQEHRHQIIKNHHQRSCCHIAAGSTSKEGWGTQTSNHHQTSCCHIPAGSTSKEGWGTLTSNHQNSSKSSPKVLLSHCSRVNIKRRMRNTNIKSSKSSPNVLLSHCSQVNIKRRMRNTNIKSSKFIKIITTGLVVTLQPGQHRKKDEEHKHQIIKIITTGLAVTLRPGQHQKKDEEHKHFLKKTNIVACSQPKHLYPTKLRTSKFSGNVWYWMGNNKRSSVLMCIINPSYYIIEPK